MHLTEDDKLDEAVGLSRRGLKMCLLEGHFFARKLNSFMVLHKGDSKPSFQANRGWP